MKQQNLKRLIAAIGVAAVLGTELSSYTALQTLAVEATDSGADAGTDSADSTNIATDTAETAAASESDETQAKTNTLQDTGAENAGTQNSTDKNSEITDNSIGGGYEA